MKKILQNTTSLSYSALSYGVIGFHRFLKDDKHATSHWNRHSEPTLNTSHPSHVAERKRADFTIRLSSRERISRTKLQLTRIWAFETARDRRNRFKFTFPSFWYVNLCVGINAWPPGKHNYNFEREAHKVQTISAGQPYCGFISFDLPTFRFVLSFIYLFLIFFQV